MATLWSPVPILMRRGTMLPDDGSLSDASSRAVSCSGTQESANVAALVDLLDHEVARAKRYGRDLSIAVFEAPLAAARERRRALEATLGANVRGSDIVVRLSDTLFALVLPETGQGVAAATERVTRLLTQVAGAPVASGFARYPVDGRAASDLLEHAMRRARAASAAEPDPGPAAMQAPTVNGSGPVTHRAPPAPAVSDGREEALAPEVSPEAIRAAREEFLRAALRLAGLEAASLDPEDGDALKQECIRQLAAHLAGAETAHPLDASPAR